MAKRVGKSERWCQRILASLRRKGYITGKPSTGRGQYTIKVVKYFEKASVVSPSSSEGVCGVALSAQKASVVTPYQEVKQEELQEKNTAQVRRVHTPEQIRQIEAKQKRLQDESELRKELYVGAGPVCVVPSLKAQIAEIARRKSL